MNELLNVVLDFNAGKIARLDPEVLISSLLKFLNCYRMQSGLNQYRIYVAFAHNSYLLFPIDEGIETVMNHKMAFDQIKCVIMDRLNKLFNPDKEMSLPAIDNQVMPDDKKEEARE